ncbi:mitogen-activated protein kinase 4-like protein [Lates japonicus]|uniref:Mitogen-activated protein kinase 4-like protein n=1 Tax=Lates japonicus TaxID=270547 RepID=A0AAD3NGA6_LATJO|nr:mitogen-activated protein kinase 4-like protein [Lates japonicus]
MTEGRRLGKEEKKKESSDAENVREAGGGRADRRIEDKGECMHQTIIELSSLSALSSAGTHKEGQAVMRRTWREGAVRTRVGLERRQYVDDIWLAVSSAGAHEAGAGQLILNQSAVEMIGPTTAWETQEDEEVQRDPGQFPPLFPKRRLRACGLGYGELDCGRSCDYKVGSPSYLDKIAWREGKPQHYSEPKLILDLSHWKRNTSLLPVPTEPIGGSVEDLGEMKEEEAEEEEEEKEETGDLFQEISRVQTQSHLHYKVNTQGHIYLLLPPLPSAPLWAFDLPSSTHYTQVVRQPSAEYDEHKLSPLPPVTSSPTALPSLLPSSPTSPFLPQSPRTVSPPISPLLPPPESQPRSSTSSISQPVRDDSLESLPVKQKERLFDLDVFISRALKLCRQNKEKADGKKGKEGGWREESKQPNINRKVPRFPEHRTPPPQTPNS